MMRRPIAGAPQRQPHSPETIEPVAVKEQSGCDCPLAAAVPILADELRASPGVMPGPTLQGRKSNVVLQAKTVQNPSSR
jgi:hypothetical protein